MVDLGYYLTREEARRFVVDYVQELYDDFYPQADGLLVESSDLKLGTGGGDYFALELDSFGEVLRAELLGPGATDSDVQDLLALQTVYFRSKTYFSAGPAADPRALADQLARGLLGSDDLAWISAELAALPGRRDRLAASGSAVADSLASRAADVLSCWDDRARGVLDAQLEGVR